MGACEEAVSPAGFIFAYVEVFENAWGCGVDREDGSTAPFSAHAAIEASALLDEVAEFMEVLTE